MAYVDGFLIPVPTANKGAYQKLAESMAPIFKKHGALQIFENWGDDVPVGELNSMRSAVLLKDDETVVFSWIIWPDKATREEGNKKVMEELEAGGMDAADMPFDSKRMILGGFASIVDA